MIFRALNEVSFQKTFGKMGISKDGGLKSGGARGKKNEKGINWSIFFCFCSFISANMANIIQGVNPFFQFEMVGIIFTN